MQLYSRAAVSKHTVHGASGTWAGESSEKRKSIHARSPLRRPHLLKQVGHILPDTTTTNKHHNHECNAESTHTIANDKPRVGGDGGCGSSGLPAWPRRGTGTAPPPHHHHHTPRLLHISYRLFRRHWQALVPMA